MKRWLLRILLLLSLGAIVNIAVAVASARERFDSPQFKIGLVYPTLVMGLPLTVLEQRQEGNEVHRVIWPGFAINTLFYAAILWAIFAAPFALRRRRRIARGLCPKCAYPIGTSEICTECGAAVKPKRPAEASA